MYSWFGWLFLAWKHSDPARLQAKWRLFCIVCVAYYLQNMFAIIKLNIVSFYYNLGIIFSQSQATMILSTVIRTQRLGLPSQRSEQSSKSQSSLVSTPMKFLLEPSYSDRLKSFWHYSPLGRAPSHFTWPVRMSLFRVNLTSAPIRTKLVFWERASFLPTLPERCWCKSNPSLIVLLRRYFGFTISVINFGRFC